MAMVGVRLSWLHRWHDLVGRGRTERTFVLPCAWLSRCNSDFNAVCGPNFTVIMFVKINHNGDGRRAFIILVESM